MPRGRRSTRGPPPTVHNTVVSFGSGQFYTGSGRPRGAHSPRSSRHGKGHSAACRAWLTAAFASSVRASSVIFSSSKLSSRRLTASCNMRNYKPCGSTGFPVINCTAPTPD
jgi:hypothetical protein